MKILRQHWPEYAIEAACLGLFMISAAGFATLLRHPSSPVVLLTHAIERTGIPSLARIPMGVAMGLTAVAIIYSPFGRRSGAHMNPAVTLTYLRLGKIATGDAAGYIAGQFLGGVVGIVSASFMLRGLPAHPSINYVTTVPGPAGALAAFGAEAAISFGMMLTVLSSSNSARFARFTGLFAGLLLVVYITIENPLSGMSMNPARTFGPALLAHTTHWLWIYFTAPLLGMLSAAQVYVLTRGRRRVRCAKLSHPASGPCIFRCSFMEIPA